MENDMDGLARAVANNRRILGMSPQNPRKNKNKLPQVQPHRNKVEKAVYMAFVKYKINNAGRLRVEGDWAIIQLAIRNALKRKNCNHHINEAL